MAQQDSQRQAIEQHLEFLHQQLIDSYTFKGTGPEQLWTWQQEKLRELRYALMLEMPMVYQPPACEPAKLRQPLPRFGCVRQDRERAECLDTGGLAYAGGPLERRSGGNTHIIARS